MDEIELTEVQPVVGRKAFLSSRQIGMIAAFGGLGFAYIAMGLYIPLVPPWIVDIREPLVALTGFAGGPWVGIMTAFVCIIVSPAGANPALEAPYYMGIGLLCGIASKKVWKLKGSMRWVGIIVVCFISEYLMYLYVAWFMVAIWGFDTATAVGIGWFGVSPIYAVTMVLTVGLAMRFAPEFMEPRWLWRGGESPRGFSDEEE